MTHKQAVRNLVDDYFSEVAKRINLENGDITPEQEAKLDTAVSEIAKLVDEWAKQNTDVKARLKYLRGEINAERISYGEIAELQSLAEHIDKSDVQLLEWAGVPEQV